MLWRGRAIGELDDEAFDDTLASVTHARLRVTQGDSTGARAVLRSVLQVNPSDTEAVQMLASLTGLRDSGHDEPTEARPGDVQPADAFDLAGHFRAAIEGAPSAGAVERLHRLIRSIERNRGVRRDAR